MKKLSTIMTVVFAVFAIPGSVALCLGALATIAFGMGCGYSCPTTPAGWISMMATSARIYGGVVVILAGVFALSAVIVVIATRAKSGTWLAIGGTFATMFALTLVFACVSGSSVMNRLADRAAGEVRNSSLDAFRFIPAPSPTPTTPPLTASDVRARMYEMVGVTLDASGTVFGADRQMLTVDTVDIVANACAETGSGLSVELSMTGAHSDDNAAILQRILAAWDAAGFAHDRAMQQDIRYSEIDPVKTMTIHDKTTIDGLIHMSMQGRCAVP